MVVMNLIFLCFCFDALTELGAFVRAGFLCFSVLVVASGPGVGFAGYKGALDPPVVCSAGRSGAEVPVLVLLFVALWFILRDDLFCVLPSVILFLCFFGPFGVAVVSLGCVCGDGGEWGGEWGGGGGGGRKAGLDAFRAFVRVALVWLCLFPLPLGVWCWWLRGGWRVGGGAVVCDCGTPLAFFLAFFKTLIYL